MLVLWRESYRITLYIHLRLAQNWRFVWEGLQYLTGFDQVLLLSTLCKQVRDEAQPQSKSLTSSSAVAVSMVVAAFLLGNPLSSSSASGGPDATLGPKRWVPSPCLVST